MTAVRMSGKSAAIGQAVRQQGLQWSVKQIGFSPIFEIVQLLLPVLGDALWIAPGLQGFEHAPVGKQGFDLIQCVFVSVQLVESGSDLQAKFR